VYKVVVLDHTFGTVAVARSILEPVGAEVLEYQCMDPDEAVPLVEDADAVLVTNGKTMTRNTIGKLRKCKIIVKHGIGPDIIDVDAASEQGIMVANVPDYCLSEVSHHALALLFACSRKLFQSDHQVRTELLHNAPALRPIKPLQHSVFGIIGFGRIGRLTARTLATIAAEPGSIIFYDPFVLDDVQLYDRAADRTDALADAAAAGVTAQKRSLQQLYAESDFIIIHAPYTKDNYHMIDRSAFREMKKQPYIINVGRGELIDNEALVEALASGMISGAGLDIVDGMPPIRADDPLLQLPNVVFTPHCAWYSEGSFSELQAKAAMEVKRVLTGEKPVSWINRDALTIS
jgi:D-3-phosphoglycerate dehydrogenase / 2-oxoglutarate reductase